MATVSGVSSVTGGGVPGGGRSGERTTPDGLMGGASAKGDTVHLSASSQIRSLKQSGADTKQIASALGMTEAQVDAALGITTSGGSAKASEVAALLGT